MSKLQKNALQSLIKVPSSLKDEIPGISTYLYEQNRSREDHEFCNAWKAPTKEEELQKEVDHLEDQKEEFKSQIDSLENTLAEKDQELEEQFFENDEMKKKLKTTVQPRQEARQEMFDLLIQFGDHPLTCDIWEFRQSGRILEMSEEEICTCGWSKLRDIVKNVKERGTSGQITKEDVKLLLSYYKELQTQLIHEKK